jgi:hypothetical protein
LQPVPPDPFWGALSRHQLDPGAEPGRWGLTEYAEAEISASRRDPPQWWHTMSSEFLPMPTRSSLIWPQSVHSYSRMGIDSSLQRLCFRACQPGVTIMLSLSRFFCNPRKPQKQSSQDLAIDFHDKIAILRGFPESGRLILHGEWAWRQETERGKFW